MLTALNSGESGVSAQQTALDLTANNIANVNTPGYKEAVPDFADLIYRQIRSDQPPNQAPLVGQGMRVTGTHALLTEGTLIATGRSLDLAIDGKGFFQVTTADGQSAYTRDGTLQVSADGKLVTSGGQVLEPQISVPPGAEVSITTDGRVLAKLGQQGAVSQIGQITLTTFTNPPALNKIGDSLYQPNGNSGAPVAGMAGTGGFGLIRQGYQESANVDLANAMTAMLEAQRAYQLNARVITNADQMLGIANNLRR